MAKLEKRFELCKIDESPIEILFCEMTNKLLLSDKQQLDFEYILRYRKMQFVKEDVYTDTRTSVAGLVSAKFEKKTASWSDLACTPIKTETRRW